MVSLEQAQEFLFAHLPPRNTTSVPLQNSVGYFLAQDIIADRDYPPFARATMDGFAIRQQDLSQVKKFYVQATLLAGDDDAYRRVQNFTEVGMAVRIMTGAPLPPWADGIVPIEELAEEAQAENSCYVSFKQEFLAQHKIKKFYNIAIQGEDAKKNDVILSLGHLIRHSSILTLASLGYAQVPVYAPFRVALISTGDEIVDIEKNPSAFQIRNSNTEVLQNFLAQFSISCAMQKHCRDNKKEISAVLHSALDCDLILISGGISKGDADFVATVLHSLGVQELFYHVNIKPGKPIWGGYFKQEKKNTTTLVLALPGNPMAVQTACKIFLEPYLRKWAKAQPMLSYFLPLTQARKKRGKRREFFPCRVQSSGTQISQILPIAYNGSGDIRALSLSHGLAVMKENDSEIAAQSLVEFIPWETA